MKKGDFLNTNINKKSHMYVGKRGLLLIEGGIGIIIIGILLSVTFLVMGYNAAALRNYLKKVRMIQECDLIVHSYTQKKDMSFWAEKGNNFSEKIETDVSFKTIPIRFCNGTSLSFIFTCITFCPESAKESFMIVIPKREKSNEAKI